MTNKDSIYKVYTTRPDSIFYLIKHPYVDKSKEKDFEVFNIDCMEIAEYKISDFSPKEVIFEKEKGSENFPETFSFDNRVPDGENIVYVPKDETKKDSTKVVDHDPYALFQSKVTAEIQIYSRLYRLAKTLIDKNAFLKEKLNDDISNDEKEKTKKSKQELTEVFKKIEDTNYFERLEKIQSENPELSIL